jgi:hypothetical protein
MNISALKAFAPAVRKQLMQAVSIKLDFALSATTPDYLATYASQVRTLRELATADRKGLVERVAYTWFNRFAALRYLDARNWHPFHASVLVAASGEDTLPELFTMARTGALPEELRRYVDVVRMESILQGRIPSADPQGEAYRMLVLGACRFYHGLLPDVFERLDDETELLLPDDLLTQQSVAEGFRTEITNEDCDQVEVLGWLYQFYISEKKDQVMARKSAVPTDDIPAVTQLFTPHWIVRYLVENSLGRLWMLNRPDSLLRSWMPYYIETEPETVFLHIERPQDIRLCDPAAGSGHMLTYAFDLLYVIYEEEGYAPSDIPGLILAHNLLGLDIDYRAAQLAALALTLKAREKTARFFHQDRFVRPHVIELRTLSFGEGELANYSESLDLGGLFTPGLLRLLKQFEAAKDLGSLVQPSLTEQEIAFARGILEARDLGRNLFLNETHLKVLRVLEQAEALTQRYHVVVANPPYMGFKQMNRVLRLFGEQELKESSSDLFSMFIQRNIHLTKADGYVSMVTMDSWMYGDEHTPFRGWLFDSVYFVTMAHLGPHAFDTIGGEVVQVTAFVASKRLDRAASAVYLRLVDEPDSSAKDAALLRRSHLHRASILSLSRAPRNILAYHATEHTLAAFASGDPLKNIAEAFTGLQTGDNPRFIKFWFEVSFSRIRFGCSSRDEARATGAKWFPYVKGSDFRKWYGNNICILDWYADGQEIRQHRSSTVRNSGFYFRAGIAYNNIANKFSGRYVGDGFVCDQKNSMFFSSNSEQSLLALSLLNSAAITPFLQVLSPKDFNPGSLKIIPLPSSLPTELSTRETVGELVRLARVDWDSFETSWDFTQSPLLGAAIRCDRLDESWQKWQSHTCAAIARMLELEKENNRRIINAYGLQTELDCTVSEDEITLARADKRRDAASFLSYAVGCMMGRYSLDLPGLILADAGEGMTEFLAKVRRRKADLTFSPDDHGIIPVLDGDWFADDIVVRTREFLRVTFGEATLRDNIRFIEESLGRDLQGYFLMEFYKDHLQTYKKRPIYWMVQSPRKGFSVLIYLHRYTRDTMNVVLNRYLRDYQVKLGSRIDHLSQVQTSTSASIREKTAARKESDKLMRTLHECQEWERQIILPLAQARVELDLDDGVKANYLKLGEALAPIPGFAVADE